MSHTAIRAVSVKPKPQGQPWTAGQTMVKHDGLTRENCGLMGRKQK